MNNVSVITTTLKLEGLDEVYASLISQTRRPSQWVIKTTESNVEGLEHYVERFSKAPFLITSIASADQGVSDGLNQGIEAAECELISILHSGDRYEPEFLSKMLGAYGEGKVVYCNVIWSSGVRKLFPRRAVSSFKLPLWDMPRINHPTFMMSKQTMKQVGGYDSALRIGMDFDWVLRASSNGVEFVHLDDYLYVMDISGLSHSNFSLMKEECKSIARRQEEFSLALFELHWFWRRLKLALKAFFARFKLISYRDD